MKEALVMFAKAPVAGEVKTRLIGKLSAEEATELYVCFLRDIFEIMQSVQDERENLSLVLCYTPSDQIEEFEIADLDGCLILAQRGEQLGERFKNCFADLFESDFDSVVIIGCDSPTLPEEFITEAFEQLSHSEKCVIGPTKDGGYYLTGLTRNAATLFESIDWNANQFLTENLKQPSKSSQTISLLPEWYHVDFPEDLEILQNEIRSSDVPPRFTKRFLTKLERDR